MNPETDKGSDKGFVLTFIALVIVATVFIGGYYLYQKYQEDRDQESADDIDTRNDEDDTPEEAEVSDETDESDRESIYELMASREDLLTMTQAIEAAELDVALQDLDQNFTLFLPMDSAFEDFELPTDQDELIGFVKAHMVGEKILVDTLISSDESTLIDLNGEEITVKVEGGNITVDGKEIVEINIEGANGVIYTLNEDF